MLTAAEIIRRASVQLLDEQFERWPVAELAAWLDEAVSTIVKAHPSASSSTITLDLARGTEQQLPDDENIIQLLDIVRNENGRAVTLTRRMDLDSALPNWHSNSQVRYRAEVRQFMFDIKRPRHFYVYPGNDGRGKVIAAVSIIPPSLEERLGGYPHTLPSYEIQTGLPAQYQDNLLDWLLYRAHSKTDLAANPARAAAHFQAFAASLGIQAQTDATAAQSGVSS